MRVLLIEDDLIDQKAFKRTVEHQHLPYDLIMVETASQARSILARETFDVILSDYSLGDETAFDVLANAGDIPVIFVTGTGNEEIAIRAMKAGAYDYLIKDSDQRYLRVLPVTVENAVKRKHAELQAKEMAHERARRQALQDFVHHASHDLRTPLTIIGTSLHLLTKHFNYLVTICNPMTDEFLVEVDKINNRLHTLNQHKDHLDRLILSLLEMVRLDAIEKLDLVLVDLNILSLEALQDAQQSVSKKQISLTFDPTDYPLLFHAEPHEFATVIRSLLKNAVDYTPQGGSIHVRTCSDETHILLEVSDTGIGIAHEDQEKIFQHFYRVDPSRGGDSVATGMGLTLVKRILALHHGEIRVHSIKDQGSTFQVTLPKPNDNE
jgi:signal transduction histidine kinase